MENASKALIMAGAVLIAILLISLGLIVFNSNRGTTEQGNEVGKILKDETFNSQFSKYAGNNVRGERVRQLLEHCISYIGQNDSNIEIIIDGSTVYLESETKQQKINKISAKRNTVLQNARYKVECTQNNDRVNKITITKK